MAAGSLAAGIAALLICWVPLVGLVGLLLGIAGSVMGAYAVMEPWKKRLAAAGLMVSLSAVALGAVLQVPLLLSMLD